MNGNTTLQDYIITELNSGLTAKRIAEKLSCSVEYVYYVNNALILGKTTPVKKAKTPTVEETKPIQILTIPKINSLIGMEDTLKKIMICSKGTKSIFLAGFHGVGKSQLVNELAKVNNAEIIRLQVTPFLTEYDIIGQPDIQKGFVLSRFAKMLQEAGNNTHKQYYLLLDEFTRGQEEAFQCLMPVLAEKTLYINNPLSEVSSITVSDNVTIFATGNLHDSGQRSIGQAEMDRWNVVEVPSLQNSSVLKKIICKTVDVSNTDDLNNLIKTYQISWKKGGEGRIIPMSIRTIIETARITKAYMDIGEDNKNATKHALETTYYGTSQAIINSLYKQTYNEIIQEVFGY